MMFPIEIHNISLLFSERNIITKSEKYVTKSEIDSAKILMHCHVASLRNKPEYVFTCFWIRQLENNEAISPFVEFLVHGTQMYFIIPARKIFVRYRALKLMLMILKYRDLNDV